MPPVRPPCFLTGTVLTPDWTRDQELEADMMAIDLMIAADYNPEAYFELLYKVADQEAEMPTQQERVAALRAQIDARAKQRLSSGLQQSDGTQILLGLFERECSKSIRLLRRCATRTPPPKSGSNCCWITTSATLRKTIAWY